LDNERTVWKYNCDRRLFAVSASQREVSPYALPCVWQSCTNYGNLADIKDIKTWRRGVDWSGSYSVWSCEISCFIPPIRHFWHHGTILFVCYQPSWRTCCFTLRSSLTCWSPWFWISTANMIINRR
jgi:hypothetical protein